jgi:phage-related holin
MLEILLLVLVPVFIGAVAAASVSRLGFRSAFIGSLVAGAVCRILALPVLNFTGSTTALPVTFFVAAGASLLGLPFGRWFREKGLGL